MGTAQRRQAVRGDREVVGHSSSHDLLHWSEHQMLDVMAKQPAVWNVWAPETYYETGENRWLFIWSSTVPKDPASTKASNLRDHRIRSVTTPDFRAFSDRRSAALFLAVTAEEAARLRGRP